MIPYEQSTFTVLVLLSFKCLSKTVKVAHRKSGASVESTERKNHRPLHHIRLFVKLLIPHVYLLR